jgi:hypothetical protein
MDQLQIRTHAWSPCHAGRRHAAGRQAPGGSDRFSPLCTSNVQVVLIEGQVQALSRLRQALRGDQCGQRLFAAAGGQQASAPRISTSSTSTVQVRLWAASCSPAGGHSQDAPPTLPTFRHQA